MRGRGKGFLVKADGERGEDRFAVAGGVVAVERGAHMVEAGPGCLDAARHHRMVGAIIGQALERSEAMLGCHGADRVHLLADRVRRQPRHPCLELGDPLADHRAGGIERIGSGHGISLFVDAGSFTQIG